jgi:hypothetical protein
MVAYGEMSFSGSASRQVAFIVAVILSLCMALGFISLAGRPAHRRLKATLEPLQREVAVVVARQVLQRRLRRPRRW